MPGAAGRVRTSRSCSRHIEAGRVLCGTGWVVLVVSELNGAGRPFQLCFRFAAAFQREGVVISNAC